MATASVAVPKPESVADLLERLGDIPPDRVCMTPPPGTATERDILYWEARTDRLFELVEGTLVEKALGFPQGVLSAALASELYGFVKEHQLGLVAGAGGMTRISEGLVRYPSISFTAWKRIPDRRVPDEDIPDLVPNLAIEMLTDRNTAKEMLRKRTEYFAAGVERVWEIDLKTRTLTVYSGSNRRTVYSQTQTVDASPVLPGFKVCLADLFSRLDETGAD